ncbi:MAG: hypothetical protein CUN55_14300, partial [Phototrophicales bacterium]
LLAITIFIFVFVSILVVASWAFFERLSDEQLGNVRVVNIAGRQRMLSQQISKNVLLITSSENPADREQYAIALSDSLDLWQTSHDALRFGDESLNVSGENSDIVERLFAQIEPHYEAMLSAGRCLVGIVNEQPALSTACPSDDPNAYVDIILANEAEFLNGMNRIVFQYDEEFTTQIERFQSLNNIVLVISLGILVISFLFVFVPFSVRTQRLLRTLQASQQALIERDEQIVASEQATQQLARNLATVVELNSRVASILNVQQLLQDVVDLLKDRFNLYHVHVYLYDSVTSQLNLVAGSGYVGELMVAEKRSIALNNPNSIVARAGRSFQSVVVNDVSKAPDFLPHPLLPDTQSEFAIALMAREQLLGVLDIQSEQQNHFTPELIQVFEIAANQIATALNNATLFESLQRISTHEKVIGNINRSIEQASTVEDILQVTVRELGKALRVPYTAIELQLDTTPSDSK